MGKQRGWGEQPAGDRAAKRHEAPRRQETGNSLTATEKRPTCWHPNSLSLNCPLPTVSPSRQISSGRFPRMEGTTSNGQLPRSDRAESSMLHPNLSLFLALPLLFSLSPSLLPSILSLPLSFPSSLSLPSLPLSLFPLSSLSLPSLFSLSSPSLLSLPSLFSLSIPPFRQRLPLVRPLADSQEWKEPHQTDSCQPETTEAHPRLSSCLFLPHVLHASPACCFVSSSVLELSLFSLQSSPLLPPKSSTLDCPPPLCFFVTPQFSFLLLATLVRPFSDVSTYAPCLVLFSRNLPSPPIEMCVVVVGTHICVPTFRHSVGASH